MSVNSMLKSSFMMLVNAVLYSNSTITRFPMLMLGPVSAAAFLESM